MFGKKLSPEAQELIDAENKEASDRRAESLKKVKTKGDAKGICVQPGIKTIK